MGLSVGGQCINMCPYSAVNTCQCRSSFGLVLKFTWECNVFSFLSLLFQMCRIELGLFTRVVCCRHTVMSWSVADAIPYRVKRSRCEYKIGASQLFSPAWLLLKCACLSAMPAVWRQLSVALRQESSKRSRLRFCRLLRFLKQFPNVNCNE